MTKEEQFLSLYKDFERLLQDSTQMSILDYENAIKDKDGELSEKRWKTYQDMLREESYSKERKQLMMKKIGRARRERRL